MNMPVSCIWQLFTSANGLKVLFSHGGEGLSLDENADCDIVSGEIFGDRYGEI